jgi:hypothetical protein
VHGLTGSSHWTRALRFDPLSLATTGASLLADRLTAPTHTRLQFALAGGGAHVSGPDNGHATSIGGGAWAGWVNGPALVAGGTVARAHTEWPSRQGTAQGANAAFHPGFGLFAKAHPVSLGRHLSLRIVPKEQDYWLAARPDLFVHRDERGRYFAALGAGPPEGDSTTQCGVKPLISDFNRDADVYTPPEIMEQLRISASRERESLKRLIARDAAYGDRLWYCFAPVFGTDFYNSNSYIAGVLRAAQIPRPITPTIFFLRYPGWLKPVPPAAFGTAQ